MGARLNAWAPLTLATTLAALLALAAASATGVDTAHAQQVDDSLPPLADLTIASEYTEDSRFLRWAVTVKNATVGAHPGRYFRLVKVRITMNDPVRGDTISIWTIRNLESGGSVTEEIAALYHLPAVTDGPEKVAQRFYAEIIESDPVELPRFRFNNATEHWLVEDRHAGRTHATNGDVGIDVPDISDRLPQPGGATTFTVAANGRSINVSNDRYFHLVADQDHTLFDVRVEISLSPGLSFAANQPEAPSAFATTTFDASTGIWNIGSITSHSLLLPVAVNLTADSLAELPLEERCLTAKVVHAVPWYANDPAKRQNDSATACLGKELLSSGAMDLIDYYPCINDTSTPCTSTGTLELVVARSVGDEVVFRQPESLIFHVPDPDGRFSKNGSLVWSTANLMDLRATQTRLTSSWSVRESVNVTAPGGGDAPGRWLLTDPDDSADSLDLLDAMDSSTVAYDFFDLSDIGNDPAEYVLDVKVDFWALGTYEALLEISGRLSGTTYTDSGTYIFHVGPAANLAVRDGGANPGVHSDQRAFTIVAVNRGPDDAPAAEVTVTGLNASDYVSHTATRGNFNTSTGVWTIGELREPRYYQDIYGRDGEVLTIVTSAAVDTEITAEITNTQDYEVCIDSSHDDVELSSPSHTACANENSSNTWHTTKYYDYISGNNTATSTAKEGRGDHLPELQPPDPKTAAIVLEWDEMEEVLNRPVTHYEVRSSDAPCQAPGMGETGTEVFGTTYVDVDLDPGDERCYYVRAVNMQMVAGPWSVPRSATSTVPMVTPPGKPTGLMAMVSNVSDIMLTWTAPSDGAAVARYEIEYSADGSSDWRPLDNKLATTTYTDSGADYGETRHYRVRAVETQGHAGEWSDTDDATTENPPPGVPTSVSAVASGQTGLIVWWLPPDPYQGAPVTHYEVTPSEPPCQTPEPGAGATSTAVFGTTYVDADLEPGDERCYHVRAVNMKMVAGAWSASQMGMVEESVTAGAPDKPVLRAAPNEGKRRQEILVSWTKPIENGSLIVSYTLEVSDAGRNGPWSDSGAKLDGEVTSWLHTGLTGATRKFYRLRATNMCDTEDPQRECHSLWSEPVEVTTDQPGRPGPPGPPTGVSATPDGDSAIDVSWLAPEDDGGAPITRYELQWSPDGASNWRNAGSTPDGETLTFKQSSLGIGITRYYRVAARNSRGLSAWSDPPHAFAMTLAGVPGRPNLTARATDANTIELTWNVPADNGSPIIRYEIEWSADGSDGSWTWLANPSPTDTSYSDGGLDPGTERHYRIRAINGASPGEGSWSTARSATTPPAVPSAPELRAEANGQNAIDLTWEPPFDDGGADISGYEIHVSTDGSENSYSRLTSPSASARSYTHSNLKPGDERHYKLRSRNRAGLGEFSQPAYGKTLTGAPAAPSLTVRANGSSEIKLSWTKPNDRGSYIHNYDIQQSDDGNDWHFLGGNISASDSEYVHTGLSGGTTKHYRIRAVNENGHGQWSQARSARTDAGGPDAPVLTLSVISDNRIDLSWTEPANNGSSIRGYWVERSADGSEPWKRLTSNNQTTTYSDDDLYRGMTRYYRVAAYNAAGTGPYSDVKSATTTGDPATPPAAPALLRFSNVGRNHVTIAWDPPEDDGGAPVTGYEYEAAVPCKDNPNTPENESEVNCGFTGDDIKATTGTSARISGLNTDGSYDFRVRAVNLVGKGEWTSAIYAILHPSTSGQVRVSPTTITVNEGATVTYTISLSTAPPHPVQVYIQPQVSGGHSELEDAAHSYTGHLLVPSGWTHPDPDEVEFWRDLSNSWNGGVRVTFTAPEDSDTDDEVSVMDHFVIPLPYDHYKPCRHQETQAERDQCQQDWEAAWENSPYRQMTGASVKVIVRDND